MADTGQALAALSGTSWGVLYTPNSTDTSYGTIYGKNANANYQIIEVILTV